MRVLCFGRFFDAIPGGMQRHVEHLLAGMAGKAEYVHLVPSRGWTTSRDEFHGFPVIRTRSFDWDGSLAISPKMAFEALRLHREHRFDLVHLHFPDPMSHLASSFLPAGLPRVITWHADIVRQKYALQLYRPFLARALESAAAIIAGTPNHISSSDMLTEVSDPAKIRVIPFGFNLEAFKTESPQAASIRKRYGDRIIFTIGRHVSYKGFDQLISALPTVVPDAGLVIGGTGPRTAELKSLAERLGVAARVHFPGHIPENELPAFYQACDVFCLPSVTRAEAFGIVQLEAMASGKPVVSTRLNTGVDFVNQDGLTGIVVPPGDPAALSEALTKLLNDPSLASKLGAAGRERVRDFSIERMVESTLSVYGEVLRRG